jgi:uncharacterized protein (TIGR03086 family)
VGDPAVPRRDEFADDGGCAGGLVRDDVRDPFLLWSRVQGDRVTAPLVGGVELLERAVNYLLGNLRLVTPQALSQPTPCRDWDVAALLRHLSDSVLALHEAVDRGHVDLEAGPYDADPAVDLVAAVRIRACELLGAWAGAEGRDVISVAGIPMKATLVTAAGALEVTVHGWDVAQACGAPRPIPPQLADAMLPLVPLLITDADRPVRFAAPVDVSPLADPGDRLLAFLGRSPR